MPKTSTAESNRFIVDLGGLKLTANDQRAVAATIQGAVLSYLAANHPIPGATVDLMGDGGGIAGMFVPRPKPEPGPHK